MESRYLGWLDYTILALTLGLSTVVGSYFGFVKQTKGSKAKAYLDGGNNMKVVPVAISICASTISSIGFLGVVSEMYEYGVHLLIGACTGVLAGIIAFYFYLPVFYNLKVSSAYEYLGMRFSKPVRMLTSLLFITDAVLYSGIVMFITSLALAQMSGISLHLINFLSCVICVFYTMMGGIKGVIWTDTLQAWMMVGSLITIIVIGTINVGGVSSLIDIIEKGKHIQIDYSLTPLVRANLLAVLTGQMWYIFGITYLNQSNIQRINSLSTIKDVRWTAILVGIGGTFLIALSHMCGLVLYANFADCDPITAKVIEKPEQLLPKYVVEHAGNIPGFPGIFIAGLFSAGLSTMSAKLNSVAGVIYHDFVLQIYHKPVSDSTAMILMKSSVCLIGASCFFMGFLVESLGQINQLCITFQSICYGAMIGLFTLGVLVPKSNTKGAVVGGICGALAVGWICIGNQKALASGALVYKKLPVSIEGCTNLTIPMANETINLEPMEEPFVIFQISFLYYALLGTLVTVIVGTVVSHFVDPNSSETVPLEYLSPPLQRYFQPKRPDPIDSIVEMKLLEKKTVTK